MNKKAQLFILPFAGGSSFSFMKLSRLISSDIEVVTVEYAGRGNRKGEACITNYEEFVLDVMDYIKCHRQRKLPYALMGYSMGSAIAFEICTRKHDLDNVQYCFFCAEGGLVSANPARKYSLLNDSDFREKIINLGGINKKLLENEPVFNDFLNLIRNDYNVLGQFVYNGKKVKCDASIIYSLNDETCTGMNEWKNIIEGNVDYYEVGDDHFFINQYYSNIAEIINSKMMFML